MVAIDGSMLEGGGQILRNSAALACITRQELHVTKIRAGRAKPGLAAQHLTGLELVTALSQGQLQGGAVRSTNITLTPVQLQCGKYTADITTAGSCSLLVQTALPCTLFARPAPSPSPSPADDPGARPSEEGPQGVQGNTHLILKGGTDTDLAPPVGYVTNVLAPLLRHLFGDVMDIKVDLVRRGLYPRGGGEVHVTTRCLPEQTTIKAFDLTDFGHVTNVSIHAFTSGRVKETVGHDMADAAAAAIRKVVRNHGRGHLPPDAPVPPITVEVVREGIKTAEGDGGGVSVTVTSSTGCILGANALAQKALPAAVVGARCIDELEAVLSCGSCVDQWMQDQLIIFMALADGKSRMLCEEPSLHCRTAMVVAEALTSAKFTVTRPVVKGRAWLVECQGAAIVRPAESGTADRGLAFGSHGYHMSQRLQLEQGTAEQKQPTLNPH